MKCKCGGIMQLKRLSYDTEAHVCVLCGRDNLPRQTPVIDADDVSEAVVKACRICGRGGMAMLESSSRCGRCIGRIKRGKDPLTNQPKVKTSEVFKTSEVCTKPAAACILAADEPELVPDTQNNDQSTLKPVLHQESKKEKTMGYKGTCKHCKRENLSLPMKDTCGRCRARINAGKDPLTGQSVTPKEVATPPTPAPPSAASETSTPALSDKQIKRIKQAIGVGFDIDVLAAIDEAWSDKRAAIVAQLQGTAKTADRLRIAFHTLASVKAMGVEA